MRQRPAPETVQAGPNQVAPWFAAERNAIHLANESKIGLTIEGAEQQGAQVELISRSTVDVERLRKALETCLVSSGLTEPQIELRRVDSLRGQGSGKLKRFVSLSRVRMTEVAQH